MKFYINRIISTFHHLQVHKFSVNHINEIRIPFFHMSLFYFVFGKELTISNIITVSIPHIEDITNVTNILLCHIQFVADNDTSNFLPITSFLKACLCLIDCESLIFDDPFEFQHKLPLLTIHITHRRERDVIRITSIVHVKSLCQST